MQVNDVNIYVSIVAKQSLNKYFPIKSLPFVDCMKVSAHIKCVHEFKSGSAIKLRLIPLCVKSSRSVGEFIYLTHITVLP